MRLTFSRKPRLGFERIDIAHSDERRSNGLDETVATRRDRSRTRVGRTERGGRVVAGGLFWTAACILDVKRWFLGPLGVYDGRILHRARSMSPTRGAEGFPESIRGIVGSLILTRVSLCCTLSCNKCRMADISSYPAYLYNPGTSSRSCYLVASCRAPTRGLSQRCSSFLRIAGGVGLEDACQ